MSWYSLREKLKEKVEEKGMGPGNEKKSKGYLPDLAVTQTTNMHAMMILRDV